ncbi:hypothetical protein QBC38DRAFT_490929 [Podospora fimiseda]|uniref:Ankyrin repeat protein n=1 Tax=Podospora fimiseda TaxID=252190 RepID=A0AAN6YMT2_9PEZI|nr:hypothetical protein QBC38DRAFT_490929 [Podospora fimiseda]
MATFDFRAVINAVDTNDNTKLATIISSWLTDSPNSETLSWALYQSVRAGSLECVQVLLENGANPNYRDPRSGELVLDVAVEKRLEKIVFELLDRGAKPKGNALFDACSNRLVTVVESLLAHGADVNAKQEDGSTPLIYLCMAPANPDQQIQIRKIAKLLVENGAHVDAADKYGQTVIHTAALNGHADLLKTLRAEMLTGFNLHRADLFRLNNFGETALHNAARSKSEETVQYLLGSGLDPNTIDSYGYTPLHRAAKVGNVPIISLLLASGADPNFKGLLLDGGTPLHLAARKPNLPALFCLLSSPGTDPLVRDNSGKTAFTYALAHTSPESAYEIAREFASACTRESKLHTETERLACSVYGRLFDGELERVSRSVSNILYSNSTTDWLRSSKVTDANSHSARNVRWIHLPANNINWAKTLLSRVWLARDCPNTDGYLRLMDLLEQGTPGVVGTNSHLEPGYYDFLDTHHEPSTDSSGVNERQDKTLTAFFMPFIQYEHREAYQDMIDTILLPNAPQQLNTPPNQSEDTPIHEATARYNLRCKAAIQAYIHHSEPLHPRRTLSQYFYSGLEPTLAATQRLALEEAGILGSDGKVILVDQLWLFTFGKDLVITCCPDQWYFKSGHGIWHDPTNPLMTVNRIERFFYRNTNNNLKSIQAVAASISSLCANAVEFHDSNNRIRFNDVFENPLTKLVTRETLLFTRFRAVSKQSRRWLEVRKDATKGKSGSQRAAHTDRAMMGKDYTVLDDLLDIGEETEMLTGLKDLQEQINIVKSLVYSQITLLTETNNALKRTLSDENSKDEMDTISKNTIQQLEARKRDLDRMDSRAKTLQNNLTSLLDLERIQSNVLEAKFARDQAVLAARQGQTILMFTIVTIIFLPISFVATIFTINFKEWSDGEDSLLSFGFVFKYIFGIGVAVSVPLVVMALSVGSIVEAAKSFALAFREEVIATINWVSLDVLKIGEKNTEGSRTGHDV